MGIRGGVLPVVSGLGRGNQLNQLNPNEEWKDGKEKEQYTPLRHC